MVVKNFVFNDLKTKKEKNDLIEFLRYQTNVEFGGYRMFDGTRTHLMHTPEELSDLISFLKNKKFLIKLLSINFLISFPLLFKFKTKYTIFCPGPW